MNGFIRFSVWLWLFNSIRKYFMKRQAELFANYFWIEVNECYIKNTGTDCLSSPSISSFLGQPSKDPLHKHQVVNSILACSFFLDKETERDSKFSLLLQSSQESKGIHGDIMTKKKLITLVADLLPCWLAFLQYYLTLQLLSRQNWVQLYFTNAL